MPFLRHFLTFLAGIGGLLAAAAVIAPADAAAVDAAGGALIEPLTIIGGAVAAGLARLVMGRLGLARDDFPKADDDARNQGGHLPGWLVAAGLVGVMGFPLPACSGGSGMPIRASYSQDGVMVGYSSKSGISVTVERGGNK
jgi:hypothetical protein